VTGWTAGELAELGQASSLRLCVGQQPRPEVDLGMVLAGGELYVRAYRGPASRWFQAAREAGTGQIRAGSVTRDVLLVPDPGPADAIDAAYKAKYGSSSTLVARPHSRAATIRIDPA
jgi:hypothetical protein